MQIQTPVGLLDVPLSVRCPVPQKRSFSEQFGDMGLPCRLDVEVRWGSGANEHNHLGVTGSLYADSRLSNSGRLDEKISEHFPHLREALGLCLVAADGPLHYFANTIFLAGTRDCRGTEKGEQRRGANGQLMWRAKSGVAHAVVCSNEWPQTCVDYEPVLGEGKERELDAARRTAHWPEATDEELCLSAEALERKLAERLPALLARLKAQVEALGFVY